MPTAGRSALARFAFALFLAALAAVHAHALPLTVAVDAKEGLPVLSRGGAVAMSSNFAFWARNWVFAHQAVDFKVTAPFEYTVSGKNRVLDFDMANRIRKTSERQLVWEFDLNARSGSPGAIGGGIAFKFDLASFGAEFGDPELLPGNAGWSWGRRGGTRIEMRFEPPLASVYFERGEKSEIRGFFYQGAVEPGHRRHVATLSVSGDVAIAPTSGERYGRVDVAAWPADLVDWKQSPVDLSFLNAAEKPAGRRGFLKAQGDKLVFGDGTVARFWGTNLTANALFGTAQDNVRLQARRLSALGFNLVRLHHHDSPWVTPNIFGDRSSPDTRQLSAAMLEKLDWWIKCLKDEGIYVWLDLHVMRSLKPGDGIDGFDEISKGKASADLKGYNYVNAGILQAMQRFNEAYLNHENRHTGLRYKDDPAIAAVLITNENDVTGHYGNALLPDKNVPKHTALYMGLAGAFAQAHGLPKDKVWRSWEPGPSKLFLNDLEHRFDIEIIGQLRAQGVKVPIATTSTWGANPLSSLPALTSGTLIDAHAYGGAGELEKNPLQGPNLVSWIAAAQVAGKPLSVTEWNVEPFPVADRHAIPLYLAAAASLQGWRALMQYAYSQAGLNAPGTPSNWHAFNDPALLATLPAAALMYRRGDVQEARVVYAFAPSEEQLFGQSLSPQNAVALRTAPDKGRLVIVLPQTKSLPWLEKGHAPAGAKVITDPQQSLIDAGADEAVSDTGELRRNWGKGSYTIDTPRTQAAMGWIGGRKISLADVEIVVTTRNATVAVQSLDNHPINKAGALLISLGARSVPKSPNQLPFQSEPVEGQIFIRAPRGLTLRMENKSGEAPASPYKYSGGKPAEAAREIAAVYKDGRYVIDLGRGLSTYWLLLK
jgi:hypothetical protein